METIPEKQKDKVDTANNTSHGKLKDKNTNINTNIQTTKIIQKNTKNANRVNT